MAFRFSVTDIRDDVSLHLVDEGRHDAITLQLWDDTHNADGGSITISTADAEMLARTIANAIDAKAIAEGRGADGPR